MSVERVYACVCAPKRLQLSTFGPHKADAALITDANSKKCDKHSVRIYLLVCVCVYEYAALGQLMETKEAMHTHTKHTRTPNTLTHTHTWMPQLPNANIFDVH